MKTISLKLILLYVTLLFILSLWVREKLGWAVSPENKSSAGKPGGSQMPKNNKDTDSPSAGDPKKDNPSDEGKPDKNGVPDKKEGGEDDKNRNPDEEGKNAEKKDTKPEPKKTQNTPPKTQNGVPNATEPASNLHGQKYAERHANKIQD